MPVARRSVKAAPVTWRGWFRPLGEQRWRLLCEADDYDSAWVALLQRLPDQSGAVVVLEGERLP
jgi:hypothetical protein